MLAEIMHVLIDLPDKVNAPLRLAVNRPDMLTMMGDTPKVFVYSTQVNNLNTPYVFLFDEGERRAMDTGLGGDSSYIYSEIEVLKVECCSQGDTDYEAKSRADALRRAVESLVITRKSIFRGLTSYDLGGTSSSDSIANLWLDTRSPEVRTTGPGMTSTSTAKVWTSKSTSRILFAVNKKRSV